MKHLPYEIEGPARRPSTFRAYARGVAGVVALVIVVAVVSGLAGYIAAKF
jgi:hypothetical protein